MSRRVRGFGVAVAVSAIAVASCGGAGAAQARPVDARSATAAAKSPPPSWYGYHANPARTGYDPHVPAPSMLRRRWSAGLDGAVYGQPLVVSGTVIVATEGDGLYGLALSTGAVRWHTKLGAAVSGSQLPCGDIDPVGVTGTPVYDPSTHRLFVVALVRTSSSVAHVLVSVDPANGRQLFRRRVDVPGLDPAAMNQRGALAVSHGRVYVPFGGNYGDCGNYRGAVVASNENGRGSLLRYVVPTPREGGIWSAGGIAVDSKGNLYVSVGNGAVGAGGGAYDGSDSVTKLSTTLHRISIFAPSTWAAENDADRDLGSTSPLLIGSYVWIQGKSRNGYLLQQTDLGGVGNPFRSVSGACASQFGGAAAHRNVIYAPCTNGLRQIVIGSDGTLSAGWRAPSNVAGSPVVGGGVVWSLDVGAGTLYALGEANGQTRATFSVGAVSRFASPTLAGGLVLIPTMRGVTALAGA